MTRDTYFESVCFCFDSQTDRLTDLIMMVEQEEHLGRIMLSCISWVCAGALSGLYLLPVTDVVEKFDPI